MSGLNRIFVLSLLLFAATASARPSYFERRSFGAANARLEARGFPFNDRLHAGDPQWFTNNLDHFDPLNVATYQQRYFVNDTWYKPGGPVFIMLGGEGPLDQRYIDGHFVLNDWAQQHHAMIYALEHRFYGASVPTKDLTTESLRFLSSQQALADAANFVQTMKNKIDPDSKWVVFGGSYPGCLSAWFRLKFPHLVVGSIASSAPVYAEEDFPEYHEVVADSLGSETTKRVQDAFGQIDDKLGSQEGLDELKKLFNLCDPIKTDPQNLGQFVSTLSGPIDGTVQYNAEAPGAPTIKDIQDLMDSADDALAAFVNLTRTFSPPGCLEVQSYEDYLVFIQNTTVDPSRSIDRQWTYQTCTEFGYFQTFEGPSQPFGTDLPLGWYDTLCDDAYGKTFGLRPHIDYTNAYYGARDLQATNVVLPNGSIDPWHALGILKDVSPTVHAVFIQGTAHCNDMDAPKPTDPPALTAARKEIASWIDRFLS